MDLVLSLLPQLVLSAPLLLLWTVGLVLAVSRRHEAPATYTPVLIALGLFLVMGLVNLVATSVLPITMMRGGAGAARIGAVLGALGLVSTLVNGTGWVLLLLALFRRGPGSATSLK